MARFNGGTKPISWSASISTAKTDVEVERALYKRLMPLSDNEQALWVLDQQINQRGIYVDQRAIKNAIALVQAEQDRLNLAMRKVTGNFVGFCTEVKRLTDWVRLQGVPVDGLAKADVLDALADQSIPGPVREALLLRQEAGKSSTAKLNAMLQRVSADGRIRGTLQYHGAAPADGRGVVSKFIIFHALKSILIRRNPLSHKRKPKKFLTC